MLNGGGVGGEKAIKACAHELNVLKDFLAFRIGRLTFLKIPKGISKRHKRTVDPFTELLRREHDPKFDFAAFGCAGIGQHDFSNQIGCCADSVMFPAQIFCALIQGG